MERQLTAILIALLAFAPALAEDEEPANGQGYDIDDGVDEHQWRQSGHVLEVLHRDGQTMQGAGCFNCVCSGGIGQHVGPISGGDDGVADVLTRGVAIVGELLSGVHVVGPQVASTFGSRKLAAYIEFVGLEDLEPSSGFRHDQRR